MKTETLEYAFYAPSLYPGDDWSGEDGMYQTWTYTGRTLAVRVYGEINKDGRQHSTFFCNAFGRTYRRNYDDFPTEHSIKLRCASLIKEIEKKRAS